MAAAPPTVREERDWSELYGDLIDTGAPIRIVKSGVGENIKSSPAKSPGRRVSTARKGAPMGIRPGNDWKGRLQASMKQSSQAVRTVTTAQGALMIVPTKRGRGRPPKDAKPLPPKILVIPPLFPAESQFAIERPNHFIHWEPRASVVDIDDDDDDDGGDGGDVMGSVEYDLDEQDMAWLRVVNEERRKTEGGRLQEDDLEYCMDRLEKHWFHLTRAYQQWHGRTEDARLAEDWCCEICGDGETTSSNLIVICDGCDVAVHQECYGVPHIPEGPWLCRKCYVADGGGGQEHQHQCSLCPWPGGALKQTTSRERPWAHLLCAHYLPTEAPVLNATFQEPIDLTSLHPARRSLLCIYCRKRGCGYPVQCAVKSCHLAFHPTCARRAGARMEHGKRIAYCWKHSSVDVKGQMVAEGPKGEGPKEVQKEVPRLEIPPAVTGGGGKRSRRSPDWLREPVAPRIILDRILSSLPDTSLFHDVDYRLEAVGDIARYWSLKRASRRGMPLLRRLHLEPWTWTSPAHGSIPQQRSTRLYLLQDLRRLERVVGAVVEGERGKLMAFRAYSDAFRMVDGPLVTTMRVLVRLAVSLDTDGFFTHPVSLADVPDYLDIIAHPMDLTTLSRHLESHSYPSLPPFTHHLRLIWANALRYNAPDTVYYRAADRIRLQMEPAIRRAEEAMEAAGISADGQISRRLLSLLRQHPPEAVWAPHGKYYWPATLLSRTTRLATYRINGVSFTEDPARLLPLSPSLKDDLAALKKARLPLPKLSPALKAAHSALSPP